MGEPCPCRSATGIDAFAPARVGEPLNSATQAVTATFAPRARGRTASRQADDGTAKRPRRRDGGVFEAGEPHRSHQERLRLQRQVRGNPPPSLSLADGPCQPVAGCENGGSLIGNRRYRRPSGVAGNVTRPTGCATKMEQLRGSSAVGKTGCKRDADKSATVSSISAIELFLCRDMPDWSLFCLP